MKKMIVPKIIYDMDIPHRAVSVYCYLCGRANKKGECFPSANTIARDLHISKRTVFRAISDLEEKKLVVRKARKRIHGGTSSNLYTLEVTNIV